MNKATKKTDALVVAYLRAAFLDQRHHYVGRKADGLVSRTAFTVDEVAGWVTALVREYPELQNDAEDYTIGVYSECYDRLAALIRKTFYLIPRRFYFYPPGDDPDDDPPQGNHNCYCACYPRFRDNPAEGARWFRWHQKLHLLHDVLLDHPGT